MPTKVGPALIPTELINSTMPVVCSAAGKETPKWPNTNATKKMAELPSPIPRTLTAPTQ